ncbi:histidinol-phosphate transaminase [Corynebacterium accolens]|uniref:histidinol-phosphate transaminase n=1 Tax=Corynebacterium accolens TaxID=38284 RepID=UPI00254A771B|nr:histidinol-phosphate transaminase [Corynebacterium accolens]MDK8469963.1 histidinol-phosphate transaminase [Corynebacterium accolens]MDK8498911.1 histidinol-phosphate transaminase [Corynebacterium accolens]MDK8593598.1 histidinol-phosphate transaminase [Corynebacterium accolens]MDK8675398.1 histidinol-phosphate transaminase [Corynebacterium accolens]
MLRDDLHKFPDYKPGKTEPNKLKLSANEIPNPPLPSVLGAMTQAASVANRYQINGSPELRAELSAYLGLPEENIAVAPGASAIVQQAVMATCHTGDEVIFPWRSFEAYPLYVRMAGAEPIMTPLTHDDRLGLDAVIDAITDRTRLIILCNPNNPTGTTISQEEFENFMARVPKDIVVLLDEAYWEYNDDPDSPNAAKEIQNYPNLIGARTFSKAFGLAGARVGYGMASPELVDALNLLALPLTVSYIGELGAIAALHAQDELDARVDETKRQRTRVAQALGVPESRANFVWLPRGDAKEVERKISEEGIIIRRYLDEGVRVSITTEEETTAFLNAWERAGIQPWEGETGGD